MNRAEDEENQRQKNNAKRNIRRRNATIKNKIARIDNAKLKETNTELSNENDKLKKQLERANRLANRNARKVSSLAPHSGQRSQASSASSSVGASRDASIGVQSNNGNDKSEISDPSVGMDKDAQLKEAMGRIAELEQENKQIKQENKQIKQENKQLKQENKQLKQCIAELEQEKNESLPLLSYQDAQIEINEIKQSSSKKVLETMETIHKSATELRKSTNDSIAKIVTLQQEQEIKKCIDDILKKDIVYEGEKKRLITKSKAMANYKLQELEAMNVYGKVSDEEWQQQMANVDERKKPVFAQNVYLNGMQVGKLHQKIKS